MFNHIMLGVIDIKESKRFYDAALGALDIEAGTMDSDVRCSFRTSTGVFMIKIPLDGKPATHGNGSTIGFAAKSSAQVDAWHAAGIANGGATCEDPPGLRGPGVYLAYLTDPAGNKLCAAHRIK
jgi:catechol 2,3-dioxygenase-like lactoylglutathione lyase family enzyme